MATVFDRPREVSRTWYADIELYCGLSPVAAAATADNDKDDADDNSIEGEGVGGDNTTPSVLIDTV